MKKVLSNNISSTTAQPYPQRTHIHYNEMIQEMGQALANAIVEDPNPFTVLYGVFNSGSGANYILSAGAIYYQGEIYYVDATTFTSTIPGDGALFGIFTTYASGDPILFTDNNPYNVHQINKIRIGGTVGFAPYDYNDLRRPPRIFKKVIPIGVWNMDTTDQISIAHGITDVTTILRISVQIRIDSGGATTDLNVANINTLSDYGQQDGSIGCNGTNVVMHRRTGGVYDNAAIYSSTAISRGWITIEYISII